MDQNSKRIPIPAVAETLAAALANKPAALVTDIDGTISHIALTPDAAVIEPEAVVALRELAEHLDLVALMTGRSATEASRMAAAPELLVIGNHGMELLERGVLRGVPAAEVFRPAVDAVMRELQRAVTVAGVIVEPKGLTGSFHYRGAPQPDLAKQAILDALLPRAAERGLRVTEGRMVVELRPPQQINKGTALRDLARSRGLRSVVFLGDDVTDIDAMLALRSMRDEGEVEGWAVGVMARESRHELLEAADVLLDGVDRAVALLGSLARLLQAA